tara:strand:- start:9026 stop:9784 length:759 start_codon:yes stop_codon:yes gene_type:complete
MNDIFENIWGRKFTFLVTFFFVFTITYLVFMALDLLPEPPAEENIVPTEETAQTGVTDATETESEVLEVANDTEVAMAATTVSSPTSLPVVIPSASDMSDSAPVSGAIVPVSISIAKLDKSINVLNPTSRTIADLDAALLEGAVRHPDSANLAQDGNVFILGHSSYLPNIMNRNFQAFNGIQNLAWGDTIEVFSADAVYTYRVEKVYQAKASNVTVPIAGDEKLLTLATCNSFGSIDDRYIVEAKRVGERKL